MTHAEAQKAEHCRATFGYWLEQFDHIGWTVMIPAGYDPRDGAPLTWAKPATVREARLYERGEFEKLADMLIEQGCTQVRKPMKKRSKWGRMLDWLRGAPSRN